MILRSPCPKCREPLLPGVTDCPQCSYHLMKHEVSRSVRSGCLKSLMVIIVIGVAIYAITHG